MPDDQRGDTGQSLGLPVLLDGFQTSVLVKVRLCPRPAKLPGRVRPAGFGCSRFIRNNSLGIMFRRAPSAAALYFACVLIRLEGNVLGR